MSQGYPRDVSGMSQGCPRNDPGVSQGCPRDDVPGVSQGCPRGTAASSQPGKRPRVPIHGLGILWAPSCLSVMPGTGAEHGMLAWSSGRGAVPHLCPSGPLSVPWHRDRAAVTACHHSLGGFTASPLPWLCANWLSERSINGN